MLFTQAKQVIKTALASEESQKDESSSSLRPENLSVFARNVPEAARLDAASLRAMAGAISFSMQGIERSPTANFLDFKLEIPYLSRHLKRT
jgi:hypothetical protein